MKVEELITDQQLETAFGHSNFGSTSKRDILKHTLLKYASGYSTGHTAKCIVSQLGLLNKNETLSKKGKQYLFEAFCDGHSY